MFDSFVDSIGDLGDHEGFGGGQHVADKGLQLVHEVQVRAEISVVFVDPVFQHASHLDTEQLVTYIYTSHTREFNI